MNAEDQGTDRVDVDIGVAEAFTREGACTWRTAAKYRNTRTAICYSAGLVSALTCSAAIMVAVA